MVFSMLGIVVYQVDRTGQGGQCSLLQCRFQVLCGFALGGVVLAMCSFCVFLYASGQQCGVQRTPAVSWHGIDFACSADDYDHLQRCPVDRRVVDIDRCMHATTWLESMQ